MQGIHEQDLTSKFATTVHRPRSQSSVPPVRAATVRSSTVFSVVGQVPSCRDTRPRPLSILQTLAATDGSAEPTWTYPGVR